MTNKQYLDYDGLKALIIKIKKAFVTKDSLASATVASATKADSAGTADSATNADYATSAGSATSATNANYATTAGSATSATSATKATQDANGDVIADTYVKSVNSIKPTNGNVTITIPSAVTESTVAGWGFTKNTGTLTSESDPLFTASAAASITATDISNWNAKTSNTGTVTSVNNTDPVNGNVTITIPQVSDTYSSTSTAAMSGVAVNSALGTLSNTYVTKTALSSASVATATSAGKADTATSATTAGSATKATQDGDGNVISSTYVKTVNTISPVNGDVTIDTNDASIDDTTIIALFKDDDTSESSAATYYSKTDIDALLDNYLPLAGGTVSGSIVPKTTNSIDLGSSSLKFKTIYATDAKLSASSLYLDDTKVLSATSSNVNVQSASGQSITLASQGTGNTNINSAGNIALTASGTSSAITMTAPTLTLSGATTVSNLTVTGNLSVTGTTTTVNSTDMVVKDNLIEINSGETGAGVTSGTAGIKIDRGTATDYYIVYDESDDKLKAGLGESNVAAIATESYVTSTISSSAAGSAAKINTDAGSATQPVYFSNGIPVATSYSLAKSVPSSAVFTDTKVTQAYSTTSGSYPVMMCATAGVTSTSSRGATTAIVNNQIYANPNTGVLYVNKIVTSTGLEIY